MQIGSEMAALQEKTPKMDPKKRFFWKIPQDFELLKKVPQNIHQTGQFGWNRYIGIWNLSHGAFQGDVGWGCLFLFKMFRKNGLEATRTTLWASTCWPSSQAKVTSVNSLSCLNSPKAELTFSLKSFHCKHSFSSVFIIFRCASMKSWKYIGAFFSKFVRFLGNKTKKTMQWVNSNKC